MHRILLISCLLVTACSHAPKKDVIAFLDTGVDLEHPYLKSYLILNPDQDLINTQPNLMDITGHGTHVAGILLSYTHDTYLLPIKNTSLNSSAKSTVPTEEDKFLRSNLALDEAITLAIKDKVHILNVSQIISTTNDQIIQAIKLAQKYNLIIVAGAGNFMTNLDQNEPQSGPFPCVFKATQGLDNVVCVGSYLQDDNKKVPVFTNFGQAIDVWAIGNMVYSSVPGGSFDFKSGTSMATPKVSAYLNSLWQQYPSDSYQEILQKFYASLKTDNDLKAKSRTGAFIPEPKEFIPQKINLFQNPQLTNN